MRSFPGPGDVEVLELALGKPAHVAADRLHKLQAGGGTQGLSLVGDAKDAAATLTYQAPGPRPRGSGDLELVGPTRSRRPLLPVRRSTSCARRSTQLHEQGSKEEKIFALNLDYMAKNLRRGGGRADPHDPA